MGPGRSGRARRAAPHGRRFTASSGVHRAAGAGRALRSAPLLPDYFPIGSLQLELPPTVTLPAEGWLSLNLTSLDDPSARTSHRLGLPAGSGPGALRLEGRSLLCRPALPGEYELHLAVTDATAPAERIQEGLAFRLERRPLHRASVRATVRPDEVTRLALP